MTASVRFTKTQAARLAKRAYEAGLAAGQAAVCEPMYVVQRANVFDDTSAVVKAYAPVMDGVCGFAWVVVEPGGSSFGRWLKTYGGGRSAYGGGVAKNVREFGQSMTRKAAFAQAYADVLREAGVKAYAESRMD